MNMKTCRRFAAPLAVIAALFCLSSAPAAAQIKFVYNQNEFIKMNPVIDIQDFTHANQPPSLGFLQCDTPVNSNSSDECFLPGDILEGISFTQSPDPDNNILLLGTDSRGSQNPPLVLTNNNFESNFVINFDPAVNNVGLNVGCAEVDGPCSTGVNVKIYGSSSILGFTTVSVTNDFDTFVGMMTSEPIVRVVLEPAGGTQQVRGVQTVYFGQTEPGAMPGGPGGSASIPTLSEWGMIAAAAGFAIIGAFYAVRRRKASA
ncbi:MAG: IPTL-CTERM sorting domain-containing protein [Candidatus Dadabacteria bacterium]|nr:IPTL-CTERM sorting domain-containing protein [Candidatus Dadabacteria bacterium]